jgi:hypothetical protein
MVVASMLQRHDDDVSELDSSERRALRERRKLAGE